MFRASHPLPAGSSLRPYEAGTICIPTFIAKNMKQRPVWGVADRPANCPPPQRSLRGQVNERFLHFFVSQSSLTSRLQPALEGDPPNHAPTAAQGMLEGSEGDKRRRQVEGERETEGPQKSNKVETQGDSHGKGRREEMGRQWGRGMCLKGDVTDLESQTKLLQPWSTFHSAPPLTPTRKRERLGAKEGPDTFSIELCPRVVTDPCQARLPCPPSPSPSPQPVTFSPDSSPAPSSESGGREGGVIYLSKPCFSFLTA